jgi:hypothetical protein
MTTIDDYFLLDLDRLQHPKRHLPEILTGQENAARHFAAELTTAAAEILRILNRPSWGSEVGNDEGDLADAAMKAAIASRRMITLMAEVGDPVRGDLEPHRGWLVPLSAVLSVTTGRILAPPSEIMALLRHMSEATVIPGSEQTEAIAHVCAGALMAQFPGLRELGDPPVPRATARALGPDTPVPIAISAYVELAATLLPSDAQAEAFDDGEILVLVKPLTPAEHAQVHGTQPPA